MLFSSIVFIYFFLPIFLGIYYLAPNKYKNIVLLVFSLLFYSFGEPKYIIILLLSCFINYYLSVFISKEKSKSIRKLLLVIALVYNIGQLFVFKYTDFFIDNINNWFNLNISFLHIIMPVGISFFTFQALSYVVDVYNKKCDCANSLITCMTYITLFPQLIAGPIVRYVDVNDSLIKREHSYDNFSEGVKRFVIGLSKKVLLANVLGELSKDIIEVTVVSSWIKPVLYTLQIYFDFSGYSDMAIGLGLMMGFRFLENFNYPLVASSITDFWRRWHISLSSWFRDYVYIPLGGNRVSKLKWFRNIFVVWFLTGFWHGASWNFIIWGLYFGVILVIEKVFLKKFIDKTKVFKYIYTLFIVVISFLIFNTESRDIIPSLKNMFFLNDVNFSGKEVLYYLKSNIVFLMICIISATPLLKNLVGRVRKTKFKVVIDVLEPICYLLLLILSTAFLVDEAFNPFLYFRF